MQRNSLWNKAQTSIQRQQYYESRYNLNKTFQHQRDYGNSEGQNPNDFTYTQQINRNSHFNDGFSSNRPFSNNQRKILRPHPQSECSNRFPTYESSNKQNNRGGLLNRQFLSQQQQQQFYTYQNNQNQQEIARKNQFQDESFVTPQKIKDPKNNYYPDSSAKSMSPVKRSQLERENEEYSPNNVQNYYQNEFNEQDRNQIELEPAQEAESMQEESDDQYMNEAYFSINESNIRYSDADQSFKEQSPKQNKKITGPSKLGEAKRRAISYDRNFIDNSYNHISNGNNSPINNTSWIFYKNKMNPQIQENAQQLAKFGYMKGDNQQQNNEDSQQFQEYFDQQQNNILAKGKINKQKQQYEQMLQDVKVNGARFYQRPQTQQQQRQIFDMQNKNKIKYINQLSLPKNINDINDQKIFNYRKCGCGALEKKDSDRNLYKREGKCESSFYQNSFARNDH